VTVRVSRDDEVAIVTIDRPHVRNAVDGPTAVGGGGGRAARGARPRGGGAGAPRPPRAPRRSAGGTNPIGIFLAI
jgi:hypothetical protein